jgi:hypothetical protein
MTHSWQNLPADMRCSNDVWTLQMPLEQKFLKMLILLDFTYNRLLMEKLRLTTLGAGFLLTTAVAYELLSNVLSVVLQRTRLRQMRFDFGGLVSEPYTHRRYGRLILPADRFRTRSSTNAHGAAVVQRLQIKSAH